jgi:two-component system, OmpR family, KDP operon response regulator KdpE
MSEKKIMIVDDDQHLVLGLSARLKAHGYKVISAGDAVSAITVARRESPDLVILDLGLPGEDGFVVLDRMRGVASLEATPVIVLSARDPAGNKKRAIDACAAAYFQKPPDNYAFLNAVRHALGDNGGLAAVIVN